jgi:hypothetical protein
MSRPASKAFLAALAAGRAGDRDITPPTVTDEQIRDAKSNWFIRARRTAVYADIVHWNYLVMHARISLGERRARKGGSREASRAIVAAAISQAAKP